MYTISRIVNLISLTFAGPSIVKGCVMVSKQRQVQPGYVYHVLNRGAERRELFHSEAEYQAFDRLIEETYERTPLPLFTYALMPNHWHFVVQVPERKEQLSEFFQYLAGTHAKRFRVDHHTVGWGHVYQDRFKSFPVQNDEHFLALCRYVERNAKRAGLVDHAEQWRWGGLWRRLNGQAGVFSWDWPMECPSDWVQRVNQPLTDAELSSIRTSIKRGRPLGSPQWTELTAMKLGLTHTLRRPGRPRKGCGEGALGVQRASRSGDILMPASERSADTW
jgi:putative transposase